MSVDPPVPLSADALAERIRAAAEEQRSSGLLPAELEARLDAHAAAMSAAPVRLRDRLALALQPLEELGGPPASPYSARPVHRAAQRLAQKLQARQAAATDERIDRLAGATRAALAAFAAALEQPGEHEHPELTGPLHQAWDRLSALDRLPDGGLALAGVRERIERLEATLRDPAAGVGWWDAGARAELLDGPVAARRAYAAGVADRLAGHLPVLVLGCGVGDLLLVLEERSVPARGCDRDAGAVAVAAGAGVDATCEDERAALARCDDRSLGAVTLVGTAEHLGAGELADVVGLASDKLDPGGLLLVDSVEPEAFVAALARDPRVQRPVDPTYLSWLCRQAGLGEPRIERRQPGRADPWYRLVSAAAA